MPENVHTGNNPGNDPDAALQAIQAAYTRQLPERLSDIGASVQHCINEPGVAAHYELLLTKLHRLAGSAGTFGFAELGRRATELEILLGSFMKDKGVTPEGFSPVAASIHAMLHWAADQNSSQLAPPTTL